MTEQPTSEPDSSGLVILLNAVTVALGGLYASTRSLLVVMLAVALTGLLSLLVVLSRRYRNG